MKWITNTLSIIENKLFSNLYQLNKLNIKGGDV